MESSSLLSPSSSLSSNSDPSMSLMNASSDKNMNRMLTNLMAEATGNNGNGGGASPLPAFIVVDDTATRQFAASYGH